MLVEEARQGRRVVLVIDEAQNLNPTVLETIRLLTDFETPSRKLLQIVLAGQQQLEQKLAHPDLAQLRQRMSSVSRLAPLDQEEIDLYIAHRLRVAGHEGSPLFTAGARSLIAARSGGIPRVINNLCFSGLSIACAKRTPVVDEAIVREAAADLELHLPREKREWTTSREFPAPGLYRHHHRNRVRHLCDSPLIHRAHEGLGTPACNTGRAAACGAGLGAASVTSATSASARTVSDRSRAAPRYPAPDRVASPRASLGQGAGA